MRSLILAVATILTCCATAFASPNGSQDFKSLSAKLWKSPKAATSLKSQKNDLAIVYGGEDISRKLSSEAYAA